MNSWFRWIPVFGSSGLSWSLPWGGPSHGTPWSPSRRKDCSVREMVVICFGSSIPCLSTAHKWKGKELLWLVCNNSILQFSDTWILNGLVISILCAWECDNRMDCGRSLKLVGECVKGHPSPELLDIYLNIWMLSCAIDWFSHFWFRC